MVLPGKRRLVVVCVFVALAMSLLGLFSLDVVLRLGPSSKAESDAERDAAVRTRLEEILTVLESGGNRASHVGQWQTARWLAERCSVMGYGVQILEYEQNGERWPNVIASRVPLSTRAEHVVAMAHIDSISEEPRYGAPGADDNGSGVAVLLEVARALMQAKTARPVAFCFFSNEEAGILGSGAFAGWAKRQDLRIPAAVNVDVVGYNRPARFLDWSAVAAHASWKGRGKALWFQVRNGLTALRTGRDALLVAGRLPNRRLVERAGNALERGSGLFVFKEARDDCG